MTPTLLFQYLAAVAGGLFCILSVVGLFWLLRLYVIGQSGAQEQVNPKPDVAPPKSTMPDPASFPNSAAPRAS